MKSTSALVFILFALFTPREYRAHRFVSQPAITRAFSLDLHSLCIAHYNELRFHRKHSFNLCLANPSVNIIKTLFNFYTYTK